MIAFYVILGLLVLVAGLVTYISMLRDTIKILRRDFNDALRCAQQDREFGQKSRASFVKLFHEVEDLKKQIVRAEEHGDDVLEENEKLTTALQKTRAKVRQQRDLINDLQKL